MRTLIALILAALALTAAHLGGAPSNHDITARNAKPFPGKATGLSPEQIADALDGPGTGSSVFQTTPE